MGKVRLRHYRDTGLHRVVNRPLRATVPPGAKNAPRHARSVGEDGAGPPPRLFLLPAATDYGANPPPVGEAFTQALPERYAVRTGKISNIIFKKWFAGNPTREYHGVGIQCDTGAAGLLLAEPASPTSACIPFFTAVNRPSRYRRSDSRRLPTER